MAINPIRFLRSIVSGVRPPSSKMDGEPYVNFADNQLGVMLGGVPMDMLGVTIFSTTAAYPARVTVVYQGTLYQSLVAVSPGAWNVTQWTKYTTVA